MILEADLKPIDAHGHGVVDPRRTSACTAAISASAWSEMNIAGTGWGPPVISGFINHYNPY